MDLRQLRYFVVLADELHFGRAAARLGISQPPLSQQVMALETRLGARLLQRSSRRVELTPAGRLFLPAAVATLEQAERAVQVAARAQRGELGELRIGLFPSASLIEIVGQSILAFRRRFPDVQLSLNELESRQQQQALTERREQIAIVRSAAVPSLAPPLVADPLCQERLMVVLRKGHRLAARRGAVPIGALADEDFVFYGSTMGRTLPSQVTALCRAAGFEPRVSQLCGANSTILGLVAAGLGIAVVPEAMCRLRHDAVVSRPLDAAGATTPVWLLRRRDDASPLTQAFVDLLMRHRQARSAA